MFFQTSSSNNVQKCPGNTGEASSKTGTDSDELMFELEDICGAKPNEVQELALDVVSKMVESWLDPTNIIQDHPCSCKSDVLSYANRTMDAVASHKATKGFEGAKSKEKRPRCNTGDKTASRSPSRSRASKEYYALVALHLPVILRLCFACPFRKVREKCRGVLEMIRVSKDCN